MNPFEGPSVAWDQPYTISTGEAPITSHRRSITMSAPLEVSVSVASLVGIDKDVG